LFLHSYDSLKSVSFCFYLFLLNQYFVICCIYFCLIHIIFVLALTI
jgi:hypothetical protein